MAKKRKVRVKRDVEKPVVKPVENTAGESVKEIRIPKTRPDARAELEPVVKPKVHGVQEEPEMYDDEVREEPEEYDYDVQDEPEIQDEHETLKELEMPDIDEPHIVHEPRATHEPYIVHEPRATHESHVVHESHNRQDFSKTHETHEAHADRKIITVAALVFVVILAAVAGSGLAIWDMQKKPSDLWQAIVHPHGVVQAESAAEDVAHDNIPGKQQDDTGDVIENVAEGVMDALLPDGLKDDTPKTWGEETEEASLAEGDEVNPDDAEAGEAEGSEEVPGEGNGEVTSDAKEADPGEAAQENPEGSDVVSSAEVAGIGQIVSAGSGQVMAVVKTSSAAPTNYRDPNENYPLNFQSVGEDYFADALFIGDSRLQGFGMWSGLPATYYCMTGFQLYNYDSSKIVNTESGKVTILEGIPFDAFTKIYIKVGLNEMGMSETKFEEIYAEFIAKLREKEPRAIIYIHAVLPVTAAKSSSDKSHNNPNIVARNEALKAFAAEHKAYFVDVGPYVSLDDGSLKPEMASDGIHMSAKYMGIWKQYLMEHAIVTGME